MAQQGQQQLPASLVFDDEEQQLPASLVFDDEQSRPSHGVSGSFDYGTQNPADLDVAQRFQIEHPLLSSPLTYLARFGKGAVDAVTSVKNAFTEPVRPDEQFAGMAEKQYGPLGFLGKGIARLTVEPHAAQIQRARTAQTPVEAFGHGLAAAIPMIGPFAAGVTEQMLQGEVPEALGGVAAGYVLGAAGSELTGAKSPGAKLSTTPSESSISAASTMIESGVKNDLVNLYAEQTIPIWKQAVAELGKTPEMFPERARPGLGMEGKRRALRTGGEHAIEVADHAVEIADRPFQDVLHKYGKSTIERPGVPEHLTVKGRILGELDKAIQENSNNPALARAIQDLRRRVETAKNFNDLQALKVLANKKGSALFDKSLGQQINASADASYSWRVLGDTIRAEMYPELSNLSGIDLSKAGRLEGIVMDARDGLRKHFYKDILNPHNKRMQQTYWQYVNDGSLARRSLLKRMMMLEPTPGGMFNQRFKQVMGGEFPAKTGMPPARPPAPLAPPTMTGAQADLMPFNAPPEVNAPEQLNMFAAPAGKMSPELGQAIFGVEQRAAREARLAPPPTITGEQSFFGEGSTSRATGKPGQPGEFFPGKKGVTREKVNQVVGYDAAGNPITEPAKVARDYRKQGQMFSVRVPNEFDPTKRSIYNIFQLRSMMDDMSAFVRDHPNHPLIRDIRHNLEVVRYELARRMEHNERARKR